MQTHLHPRGIQLDGSQKPRVLRILLVEDDPAQAEVAHGLLEALYGANFRIELAANAAEARQYLRRKNHDVVLLDYRLGDETGLDLLKEAPAIGVAAPIILLTGQNDRDVDLAAMHQGAADYLVKGQFTSEALDRAIRYAIERQRSRDALKQAHGELEQRVNTRTAELARAKREVERASRAKSDFLSRISHELRTPMNAILGFAQLLEMDDLTEAQRDSLDHISTASRHLLSLINDMLDISGAPAEREDLSEILVNVPEIVETAVAAHEVLAARHQVTIKIIPNTEEGTVLADPRRLHQVLGHLLTNAIKFHDAGGEISVSHQLTPHDSVRVTVRDNGRGIAMEDLPKLFTPFERLDAEERGIEGAGLGLALSKRLLEAMGGSITVESTKTVGSSFSIELPSAPAGARERIYPKMHE
jgi:signal transduction histidine kinase